MSKIYKFDNFLRTNNISQIEKVNSEGQIVYKGNYSVGNTNLLALLFIDEEVVIDQICTRIITLDIPSKRNEVLKVINEINFKYKTIKIYLDSEDNVDLTIDYLSNKQNFSAELLFEVLIHMTKIVETNYSKFMKIQWA